jgi:hypothetical protein
MTPERREELEYKSRFTDKRYAKQAWKELMAKSLEGDADELGTFEDNRGNETPQSIIYRKAYEAVARRLKKAELVRKPQQAEVIVQANIIRAAFDNQTFNTIMDRTAGKVKDEIEFSANQFEELTDEELELLAVNRAKKLAAPKEEGDNNEE